MTEFKRGQKVRVSFEATVVETDAHDQCVQVVTPGAHSYVHPTLLELILPYEDGKEYIDADGERLTFCANTRAGGPGWRQAGSTYVAGPAYAKRPLRPVGDEIEE